MLWMGLGPSRKLVIATTWPSHVVAMTSFSSDRRGWNNYFSSLVDFVHRCVREGGSDLISIIKEIKNELDPGMKFVG